MPQDKRRAELKSFFTAHPDLRKALLEYRNGVKQSRLAKQQTKLQRREQRLKGERHRQRERRDDEPRLQQQRFDVGRLHQRRTSATTTT